MRNSHFLKKKCKWTYFLKKNANDVFLKKMEIVIKKINIILFIFNYCKEYKRFVVVDVEVCVCFIVCGSYKRNYVVLEKRSRRKYLVGRVPIAITRYPTRPTRAPSFLNMYSYLFFNSNISLPQCLSTWVYLFLCKFITCILFVTNQW